MLTYSVSFPKWEGYVCVADYKDKYLDQPHELVLSQFDIEGSVVTMTTLDGRDIITDISNVIIEIKKK